MTSGGQRRKVVDSGSALLITFETGGRVSTTRHNFVRGRWYESDGLLRLSSSPPPGLEAPEHDGDVTGVIGESTLAAQLTEAAHRLPGRVNLRLSLGRRKLVGYSTENNHINREEWVWSLAGSATLRGGRVVPLGRSGPGARLEEVISGFSDMDWLCRSVGEARKLRPQTVPVVLAPQAAAVLVHEAIGHFAEAPVGRCAVVPLGSAVASNLVTVEDNPQMVDGVARYDTDDEGIAVLGPTPVVGDGILVAMLHSRESAQIAQTLPTPNSRSASAWLEPIPRMSNLYCHPGSTTIEALLASVDNGLFIHHLADGFGVGSAVEVVIVLAERISHGQLTAEFFTGGVISEEVGVLRNVTGVGNHVSINPNAMCGKSGQLLADVGTFAPALALSSLRIL